MPVDGRVQGRTELGRNALTQENKHMTTLIAQLAVAAYMACFGMVFIALAFFDDDEPEWLQNMAGWLLLGALSLSATWAVMFTVGFIV